MTVGWADLVAQTAIFIALHASLNLFWIVFPALIPADLKQSLGAYRRAYPAADAPSLVHDFMQYIHINTQKEDRQLAELT